MKCFLKQTLLAQNFIPFRGFRTEITNTGHGGFNWRFSATEVEQLKKTTMLLVPSGAITAALWSTWWLFINKTTPPKTNMFQTFIFGFHLSFRGYRSLMIFVYEHLVENAPKSVPKKSLFRETFFRPILKFQSLLRKPERQICWHNENRLEVQPPFLIGWFPKHQYFSRGLSSSKRNHHFNMVVDFQGIIDFIKAIPQNTFTCWLSHPLAKYARQIGSFPQGSGWKYKMFETTT